ncbi:MurR/RpiR family transcriptional regulator [Carnobacterium gallinarum]|uniref:MurR/RpiR family transcriptional regulator n=1 Tax=Carnobacterium gallinarum TaxID=2749 RepID=UPI0005535607|nr:SIS domain-containing protein [Carnobacterium gallinarum]
MTKIYYLDRLIPKNVFREDDKKMIEKIVDAILNKESLDIRHIAQINFTSPASISRLAKRGGFNNFKELIFFLSNQFLNVPEEHLPNLPFVTCTKEWDVIDQYLIEALAERKVYLFGEGFCQFLVNYTYRKLLLKKIYAVNLDGVEISLIADETPHTLFTFSQSGENKHGLTKIIECKNYGGKVITFTATPNSSYSREGDISFIIDNGTSNMDQENFNLNYFYGNSLNLMEYLISRYTKKEPKNTPPSNS